MERSREYDEMIEEARSEYRIGLRHLANMMGADPETFTQDDANVSLKIPSLISHNILNLSSFSG